MTPLLRVVLDTNVYISGLVFGGRPASILGSAVEGLFTLCVSREIRCEVEQTLREKFEWSAADIRIACEPLWARALHVTPTQPLNIVKTDPDDDRILECALAAGADVLVTGDDHLLKLTERDLQAIPFRRRQIVTVREFVDSHGF